MIDWNKVLISAIPYIISFVALVFSFRKQKHEEVNIDATAIKTFADTTASVGKQYKELLNDYTNYKSITAQQLTTLEGKLALVIKENGDIKDDNRVLKADNLKLKETNSKLVKTNGALTRWIEKLCKQLKDEKITPVSCDPIE